MYIVIWKKQVFCGRNHKGHESARKTNHRLHWLHWLLGAVKLQSSHWLSTTNAHEWTRILTVHWIHGRNRMPRRRADYISKDFMVKQNVDCQWDKRLRLLGGSSRFAQALTTTCGSAKFIVCWLGGCESASCAFPVMDCCFPLSCVYTIVIRVFQRRNTYL